MSGQCNSHDPESHKKGTPRHAHQIAVTNTILHSGIHGNFHTLSERKSPERSALICQKKSLLNTHFQINGANNCAALQKVRRPKAREVRKVILTAHIDLRTQFHIYTPTHKEKLDNRATGRSRSKARHTGLYNQTKNILNIKGSM